MDTIDFQELCEMLPNTCRDFTTAETPNIIEFYDNRVDEEWDEVTEEEYHEWIRKEAAMMGAFKGASLMVVLIMIILMFIK